MISHELDDSAQMTRTEYPLSLHWGEEGGGGSVWGSGGLHAGGNPLDISTNDVSKHASASDICHVQCFHRAGLSAVYKEFCS